MMRFLVRGYEKIGATVDKCRTISSDKYLGKTRTCRDKKYTKAYFTRSGIPNLTLRNSGCGTLTGLSFAVATILQYPFLEKWS